MVAGTVAKLSSPEESRYIYCQNESKINVLYCWESKMLETMSQIPPSQTWLKVCKMEKKPTNPNNRKLGFVLAFLSQNPQGVCGQAFDRNPHDGGQGTSGRRKNIK